MANYTAIPNSDLDAESPITQSLMEALSSNPIAIAEAATGAPKISGNAFEDGAIPSSKITYSDAGVKGAISVTNIDTNPPSYKTINVEGILSYAVVITTYNGGLTGGVQIYINNAWREADMQGVVFSTGANVRIYADAYYGGVPNPTTTATFNYDLF
ncbi:MAG: hypothetical protein COA44_06225 [Arcobacter sp.]|nr:MAG: hypothetical protein COA44_06225 [Arcobacter sp.]